MSTKNIFMAHEAKAGGRTYLTLSLSLPPEAVRELERIGKLTGKTAARVAAEVALRLVSAPICGHCGGTGKEPHGA